MSNKQQSEESKFTLFGLPKKHYEYIYENAKNFEDWIDKAIKNKCYIEAIVLIHNTIELYLRGQIIEYLLKLENKDRLDDKKYKILFEIKQKNVFEYAEIAYLFNLISKGLYDDLNNFNTNRNTAIHGFLKNKITYEEFKDYCKEGREIQLRLSPFNHSKEDIKSIMQHFEDVSK